MIKAIVLTTGYVESQKTGVVWFTHKTGFKTAKEAIKHLAEELKETWWAREDYSNKVYIKYSLKDCCKKNVNTSNYCPDCGAKLTTDGASFDYDAFQEDVLYNLSSYTCDSWPFDEQREWCPWSSFWELKSLKDKEIVCIEEKAEEVLADAIRPVKDK